MNILNKHSNLTPQPRIDGGTGIVKSTYNVFTRKNQDNRNNNGGLSEHACHFSNPYTCISTAF